MCARGPNMLSKMPFGVSCKYSVIRIIHRLDMILHERICISVSVYMLNKLLKLN